MIHAGRGKKTSTRISEKTYRKLYENPGVLADAEHFEMAFSESKETIRKSVNIIKRLHLFSWMLLLAVSAITYRMIR